jgi:hypothetical protein
MIGLVMPMRRLFRPASLSVFTLLALACQKENPEPDASIPSAARALPAAPKAPSASVRAPASETPFAGQDTRVGTFVETSAYKFRVDTVVRCADPGTSEKVPDDRRVRVAAKVGVFSKYDSFFLSARDITLEKGGVIINAEKAPKNSAECAPLLEQKRLNHDETSAGFVVFQVPDEAFVRDGIVAFKPTRWGGAPRTEIKIGASDFVTKRASPSSSGK